MNVGAIVRKSNAKIAVIDPWCTGCGGAPVCLVYCKQMALRLVRDNEAYPFNIMTVDGSLCIGCGACASAGRQGILLSGCPWNAIRIEPRSATRSEVEYGQGDMFMSS